MPKNILLITQTSLYPLFSGGAQAQYYFIDGLKDDFNFSLCNIVRSQEERQAMALLQEQQPKLRIHSLDLCPPPAKKSVLSKAKSSLRSRGKRSAPAEGTDDFSDNYFEHVDHAFPAEFIDLINRVICEDKIDTVQFDFYDCIDIVFALPENIRKVFIHHEVRFKRLQLASAQSPCSEAFKRYLTEKTAAFEKSCLQYMDEVGVFNEDDKASLAPYCKKITLTPFAIPDAEIYGMEPDGSFNHLLFCGSEGHTPNSLGLKWFLDEIYLPQKEDVSLPVYITGKWSEEFREPYKNEPGIIFCGIVDSLAPMFKNAVFVNPILTGAGIRTKVLHALVNKVPVLSTRFGAEGCYAEGDSGHIAFFDSADEFLDRIKNCDFSRLSELGYEYYNREFNKEKLLGIRRSML